MYLDKEIVVTVASMILGLLILTGVWVISSHMEAKAYNRVTRSNVTTWEAMWIQLRVQNPSASTESQE